MLRGAAGNTESFLRIKKTLTLLKNREEAVGSMAQQNDGKGDLIPVELALSPFCSISAEFRMTRGKVEEASRLRQRWLLLQGAMLHFPYKVLTEPGKGQQGRGCLSIQSSHPGGPQGRGSGTGSRHM